MNPRVGDQLPPFVIDAVSAEAMKDWARFLHDPNPIHLDASVVRTKGLGDGVINQGPANVAYLMNMLLAAFPGARIAQFDARFVDNVFAGERVEATGEVTRVDGAGVAGTRVSCAVALSVEGRGAVLTGNAEMIFGDDAPQAPIPS